MADIYEDARRYDALTQQHFGSSDLDYWKTQAASCGGPALELACGAGRLTLPIAQQGTEIAGLDASASMLALAREKADNANLQVNWHQGDMTDFDLT